MKSQKNISNNKNLFKFNSLKISVYSKYFIDCKSEKDLQLSFNLIKTKKIPFFILGEGTNVVFKKNFNGLIIKNSFKKKRQIIGEKIIVSGGYNWDAFVRFCLTNSFYGLENLSGIPGSVGASPVQNIGAYGVEVSSFIDHIEVYNLKTGNVELLNNKNCNFNYRHSIFKESKHLFIKKVFFKFDQNFKPNLSYKDLEKEKPEDVEKLRKKILQIRNQKLENHRIEYNVGSFFKNPIIEKNQLQSLLKTHANLKFYKHQKDYKVSAAWLIEQANLKGFALNKSKVSKKHSLVLVNKDKSSNSILKLSKKIKDTIKKKYKIILEEEPTIVG